MSVILYLTSNAIRIYAVCIFIDTFLGKSKLNPKLNALIYFAYYFLGSMCWLITKNSTLNIIVNIALVVMITMQYCTSWKKRIFASLTSCTIGMFIDWIAVSLFGYSELLKTGFVQDNVALVLAFIFKNIYVRKTDYSFKSKYSLFLISIAVGTIIIGILTVNSNSSHDYFIAIVLLLINLMKFYIFNLEQKHLETQHMLELIEVSNHAYKSQIQIMQESQKKLRFIRHDLQKHLNRIRNLVDNEDFQSIPDYLFEMEEAVAVKHEYSKTGNEDVDSLLNYELSRAVELGTEIIYDVNLPEKLNVSSFDITIILGNLMDNAIEALKHSERKLLKVNIQFNKGIIRIDIENTYNSSYKKKNDGREHGIGLMSVESALQKYHGKLDAYPEENHYHTTAIFFNSLDEQ